MHTCIYIYMCELALTVQQESDSLQSQAREFEQWKQMQQEKRKVVDFCTYTHHKSLESSAI